MKRTDIAAMTNVRRPILRYESRLSRNTVGSMVLSRGKDLKLYT
jgi:predicted component of type VI protein secretion system